MPGPTTEQLDRELGVLNSTLQDMQLLLTKVDGKLGVLDELKVDLKANTVGIAAFDTRLGVLDARLGTVDARLSWLIGAGKWIGSIFALAAVYGVLNMTGRLSVVETQLKNIDGRLVEMREAISKHQTDSSAELEERINRLARSAVDEAIRRAALPKTPPSP